MNSTEHGSRIPVVEKLRYTPENLGRAADLLAEVLDQLRLWGVKIHQTSRLARATVILREVHAAGRFPEDPAKLRRLGLVLGDVQDFNEIGDALPPQGFQALVHDLRMAVGGTYRLGGGGTDRKAQQHQTQLWVGAILAHAGVQPGILSPDSSTRPDFRVENGTREYAIEVKRPVHFDAHRIVRDASAQLVGGDYHCAALLVDLTDCIPDDLTCVISTGAGDMSAARAEVRRLVELLHAEVYSDLKRRLMPGREHIRSITGFGRLSAWDLDDLSEAHLSKSFVGGVYWRGAKNTLLHHRAKWLASLIHIGLESAGHQQLGTGRDDLPWRGIHSR